MFNFFNKKPAPILIDLPRTEEDLENIIDMVMDDYCLTNRQHAAVCISTAIRHLPSDTLKCPIEYLAGSVIRNMAYNVCTHKVNLLQHESQINQLTDMLTTEPNNQQARDELEKAAREGSVKAREALDKLFPDEPKANVTPIAGAPIAASESTQGA